MLTTDLLLRRRMMMEGRSPLPAIDYSKMPLTIEAIEDGSEVWFFYWRDPPAEYEIQASVDGGDTWYPVSAALWLDDGPVGTPAAILDAGESVQLKGDVVFTDPSSGTQYNDYQLLVIKETENVPFRAYGNIVSVLESEGFETETTLPNKALMMFFNYSGIKDCENLVLQATTLGDACCSSMFADCSELEIAPKLPALSIGKGCYTHMFERCQKLQVAPELPATTLQDYCYGDMFNGCEALTLAPVLPATILAENCYNGMFVDCTSLATASALPATTLAEYCYSSMFYGCTNLSYIKALFTTTPSNTYTANWVSGVKATGTFVKSSSASWDVTGADGVPSGWTVETE